MDLQGSLGYAPKQPLSQTCSQCHSVEDNPGFVSVHNRHLVEGIACSSCHNFSRPERQALKSKIGIYNGGNWYIDFNGDGQFIPATGDKYIPYGASGWTQIVGDWNGDGKSEIGIFKDGLWYIDYGGSGVIDANTRYYSFGGAGWTPLVGDWNNDKKDEIGVYQNGNWYLDYDGNWCLGYRRSELWIWNHRVDTGNREMD